MTQIRVRPSSDGPATHALIIGVGYYRHLMDGPEPAKRGKHLGLSVLESPPKSAREFADWLLAADDSGSCRLSAPLGTVEVLISGRETTQLKVGKDDLSIERASSATVDAGFGRWLNEVKSDARNVGVVYFCGHGIMGNGAEQYLLLDDHAVNENKPFAIGSFDISSTLRALYREVRAQLYVFIDACQTHERRLADKIGGMPAPLFEAGASTQIINQGTTEITSSGEGLSAYGDCNGISHFTDALLRAFRDGYCGVPQPGKPTWLVNGQALSQSIPKLLGLVNKDRKGEIQSCTTRPSGPHDVPLCIRNEAPMVRVEIEVTPEQYQAQGSFTMRNRVRTDQPPLTGGKQTGIWKTDTRRGVYSIQVQSDSKAFQDFERAEEEVDPPLYQLPVEVEP